MNCDEFSRRMHERLDNRMSLETDDQLRRHTDECDTCRAHLTAWRKVALIMPSEASVVQRDHVGGHSLGWLSMVAVTAAAMLIAVTVIWYRMNSVPQTPTSEFAQRQDTTLDNTVLAQSAGELDPSTWWRSVQDRDWMGQTMPAVESVRSGVAPLGRSLMRAVTILTIGGRSQTS